MGMEGASRGHDTVHVVVGPQSNLRQAPFHYSITHLTWIALFVKQGQLVNVVNGQPPLAEGRVVSGRLPVLDEEVFKLRHVLADDVGLLWDHAEMWVSQSAVGW
jgi:hypothetical protein